jgi:ubiquinone/menaquinone biosynthesis C-methylase UbiE
MPDKDLFKGTAEYYALYRPGIPEPVTKHIVARFNLKKKGTLLDIGCGTGQSTYALAPFFSKAVAIDPDQDMLNQAKKRQPANIKVEWQRRAAEDLTTDEGPYRLVVASRAFHWTDQYPLLDKLQRITEPEGGIAIIGDGSFWTGKEPWQKRIKEVVKDFLGEKRRAGNTTFNTSEEPYVEMLRKSGYGDVEYHALHVQREWDLRSIIGCLYSTSFAAPRLFGDKLQEFESQLSKELVQANQGKKRFLEDAEFTIQSGRIRPS